MKLIFINLLILLSFQAFAGEKDCTRIEDDCSYYLCEEAQRKCGRSGYLVAFGHKYCEKYKTFNHPKLSIQAKVWMRKVRNCLMDEISYLDLNKRSCQNISDVAMSSHIGCYIRTGYCSLPLKDKALLATQIRKEWKNPDAISNGLRILSQCSYTYKTIDHTLAL